VVGLNLPNTVSRDHAYFSGSRELFSIDPPNLAADRMNILGRPNDITPKGRSQAARQATITPKPPERESTMTIAATDQTTMVVDFLKQFMFDPNQRHHELLTKPTFGGPSDRNYNLKNSRTRRFLQWEEQTFGINLGWTDDDDPGTATRVSRWFIARPTGSAGPVRYGESIALGYGKDPSFIRYEDRTVGINLNWSNSPVFEWKLLGGPAGRAVRSGDWLAIYNKRAGDCLIYFDRTLGGDIGWPSSKTWTQQFTEHLGKLLTQAVKEHWKEAVALLLAT